MPLNLYFSIAFLSALVFWQIVNPNFLARKISIAAFAVASGIIYAIFLESTLLYFDWLSGPISRLLLPPHQSISYFLTYVWWRFVAPHAFSGFLAILFFYLAYWYNKRHDYTFFYNEELYYLATGVFLVGHPLWIFYFIAAVIFASVVIGFRALVLGKKDKFSLYYFWLPTAAFVIIISKWLAVLPLYLASKF